MLKTKFFSPVLAFIISCSVFVGCNRNNFENTNVDTETTIEEVKSESTLLNLFSNKSETIDISTGETTISSNLFKDGVSVSDIQQGQRPVCYFLSALAGLAYHRPSDIEKLVTENPDGTFTVNFPGLAKSKQKITVDPPNEGELAIYTHQGKNTSIWVAVMVKAIAKHWSKTGLLRFLKKESDAANWGGAWEGIEIVTGHVADFMLIDINTSDRLLTKMSDGLSKKKLVSISTFGKGNINPKKTGEPQFSKAHVMTVLNVDKVKRTVSIRDPYGSIKRRNEQGTITEDKSTDGVFTLTIDEVKKYFRDLAIETDKESTFISRLRYLK